MSGFWIPPSTSLLVRVCSPGAKQSVVPVGSESRSGGVSYNLLVGVCSPGAETCVVPVGSESCYGGVSRKRGERREKNGGERRE